MKLLVQLPEQTAQVPSVTAVVSENEDSPTARVLGAVVSKDRADELAKFCDTIIHATRLATLRSVATGKLQAPALATVWQDAGAGGGDNAGAEMYKSLNGNYRRADERCAPIVAAAMRGIWGEATLEHRTGTPANFAAVLRRLADAIESGANLENCPLTSGKIPAHH